MLVKGRPKTFNHLRFFFVMGLYDISAFDTFRLFTTFQKSAVWHPQGRLLYAWFLCSQPTDYTALCSHTQGWKLPSLYIFRTPTSLAVNFPSGCTPTGFTWHFRCHFFPENASASCFWDPWNYSASKRSIRTDISHSSPSCPQQKYLQLPNYASHYRNIAKYLTHSTKIPCSSPFRDSPIKKLTNQQTIFVTHFSITPQFDGYTCGVMVIIVGNGHSDSSSNSGRDRLHFQHSTNTLEKIHQNYSPSSNG